jgi:putative addiction module component (TIGR02574 family)
MGVTAGRAEKTVSVYAAFAVMPSCRVLARWRTICTLSCMPMTIDQILEETSQLPADVVSELVDRMMLAKHGGINPKTDAAWHSEIHRRIEEIESGKVKGIPGEEVSAQIRKIVGR